MSDINDFPASSSTPTFSFITTCKGRLHHLQQTLPLLAAQKDSEVIVVDYGCPQQTGDWVEQHYPQVKVVRMTDDSGFRITRARNAGARASKAPWLIFIDADIRLVGDLPAWLKSRLAPGKYFWPNGDNFNLYGTCACYRKDFEGIGGYDEVLVGWGREDKDLYYRLVLAGCEQILFPENLLYAIEHGDEERTQFSPYKNKLVSQIISSLYLEMKYDLSSLGPEQVPLERRKQLYEQARNTILNGISQNPNANMVTQLMLGPIGGPAAANPLFKIERKLVYLVKPHLLGRPR